MHMSIWFSSVEKMKY